VYAWIWRHLPGPWPAKLVAAVLLFAAIVALLMLVVFPVVEPFVPFTRVAVL
jgi:hypothetical protein